MWEPGGKVVKGPQGLESYAQQQHKRRCNLTAGVVVGVSVSWRHGGRGCAESSASTGFRTLEQRGSAACTRQNDANILSSSESLLEACEVCLPWNDCAPFVAFSPGAVIPPRGRLRGFNEPRLRQFWQLFNICPAGQTRSYDGVYLWQFNIRKTLSFRRHQPVGPGGTQRRRFPFQRGKFMSPYFLWLFVTIAVVFKHTSGDLFVWVLRSSIASHENSLNQTHPYSLFRQEPDLRRGGANIRSWAISGASHQVWPPRCANQCLRLLTPNMLVMCSLMCVCLCGWVGGCRCCTKGYIKGLKVYYN